MGLIKDVYDPRDYRYVPRLKILPQSVNLICGPVKDQGNEGSCAPHAVTSHMEAIELGFDYDNQLILSPQFLYYHYREMLADVNEDGGCMLRMLFKLVAKDGVCRERLWPYSKPWNRKPVHECYTDAENHQILQYLSLSTVTDMISCIASGYGFVGGIPVYESFDNLSDAGVVPNPERGEKLEGYHAIYFHGYNQRDQTIYFQNSWSKDWGQNGHAKLSFAYMSLGSDYWTVRTMEDNP